MLMLPPEAAQNSHQAQPSICFAAGVTGRWEACHGHHM